MKKINEMSVKELREVAKELNIEGRWDMTKVQLVEAIEKVEAEKKVTKKENAVKIQREFVEVAEARKELYRYITITVKNLDDKAADEYVETIVSEMNRTYEFEDGEGTFKALKCPAVEDGSYTDMISFEKHNGKIKEQLKYVGKLMTKAIKTLK